MTGILGIIGGLITLIVAGLKLYPAWRRRRDGRKQIEVDDEMANALANNDMLRVSRLLRDRMRESGDSGSAGQ